MASFRHLLATHGPLLIIDAASARIQVGLCSGPHHANWETSEDEAGVGVFECMEKLSAEPAQMGAFVFCDGPGSVLGVRTVAMALRTWCVLKPRPVFAYASLVLAAHAHGDSQLAWIADARRETWHHYVVGADLRRVPSADLRAPLASPEGFRNWTPLPDGVNRVPYSLEEFLPRVAEIDLFRATDTPDAFLHEEPSYVTWSPKIHRPPLLR